MKTSNEKVIIGSIAAGFLVIFGAFIYFAHPSSPSSSPAAGTANAIDASVLIRPTTHTTASSTAKVMLVEFGDFQCPACGMIHPALKRLVETYKDNPDFTFAFRHFPLPQHKNAVIASEAAEAAGAQGKFWEMHDMLYEHQNEWSESSNPITSFTAYAAALGIDIQKFTQDLANHTYRALVQADASEGNSIRINHTPTLFLNGIESQSPNVASLKAEIDAALAQ